MRSESTSSAMLVIAVAALSVACGGSGARRDAGTAASAPAESGYRIGPGDQLNVFVFNHPELSVNVPVRPDGLVSTPLADDVQASGKTPTQLARDLEARLAEYVRSPKVNVMVTTFRGALSDQIRVVGAAARPQSLPYRASLTLLDVIIEVGGLSEFAAGNRARIVRQTPTGEIEIRVRLDDLLNDGDITANLPMQPGDVLIIPESRF